VTITGVTTTPPYSFEQPFFLGINEDNINRIAGVYGQVTWNMTPTLQWQVGARENWDNNPTRATVAVVALPGILPPQVPNVGCSANLPYQTGSGFLPSQTGYLCIPQTDQSLQFQDKTPTGKIDLNWTPWAGQFFYAFFARGYKAGGAQNGGPNFQPEHVNDWELGWKGTYGGWLQASLGGYYMIYQGMQQSVTLTSTVNGGGFVTNLGSSTLEGIEAEMHARIGGLGINFDGSLEHSRLGAVNGVVAAYELPPQAANLGQCGVPGVAPPPACFNYLPYAQNLSGEQEVFAPPVQGTLGIDYRFHVLGGVLDPGVLFSYTARQYAALFEIPFYEQGARHIWNAYLNYDVNQWNAELYINNFTNQVYFSGNGGGTVNYGSPMQLGIRVRRDF
jgi:iron complex outermembrane receptor protein